MKEEEIENEFVNKILKKKRESESAIFKKLERKCQPAKDQRKSLFSKMLCFALPSLYPHYIYPHYSQSVRSVF